MTLIRYNNDRCRVRVKTFLNESDKGCLHAYTKKNKK